MSFQFLKITPKVLDFTIYRFHVLYGEQNYLMASVFVLGLLHYQETIWPDQQIEFSMCRRHYVFFRCQVTKISLSDKNS